MLWPSLYSGKTLVFRMELRESAVGNGTRLSLTEEFVVDDCSAVEDAVGELWSEEEASVNGCEFARRQAKRLCRECSREVPKQRAHVFFFASKGGGERGRLTVA